MNSRSQNTPAGDVSEAGIEATIVRKGLTHPRVTPEDVDNEIVSEDYHRFPGTTNTACLLTLRNGFTVTGESACASAENFDEEVGRTIARRNARDKIWSLLGFRLRDELNRVNQGPRYRSAIDGLFVTEEFALANPDITVREGGSEPNAQPASHQDRVRAEHADLQGKISRLSAFIDGDSRFDALPIDEQARMRTQRVAMRQYERALSERIAAFS